MTHRDEVRAGGAGRALRTAAVVALLLAAPWAGQHLAAQDDEPGARAEEPGPGGDGIGQEDLRAIQEILDAEAADLAGEGYGYDPAGRRDPFIPLNQRRDIPAMQGCEEVSCLLIEEIDISGVFITRAGPVAQAYSTRLGKSYLLREGDELADGDLLEITADRVVFKQYLEDPRSLKPFQEVVKELNP